MPPTDPVIPLRPTRLLLAWPCPRCARMVMVTTVRPASTAGDRAVLCDELQADLNVAIDEHAAHCAPHAGAAA